MSAAAILLLLQRQRRHRQALEPEVKPTHQFVVEKAVDTFKIATWNYRARIIRVTVCRVLTREVDGFTYVSTQRNSQEVWRELLRVVKDGGDYYLIEIKFRADSDEDSQVLVGQLETAWQKVIAQYEPSRRPGTYNPKDVVKCLEWLSY